MHPGQRNSLDALCKRYGIDNSRRELHGALLDACILAEVYLAMTGGQSALELAESRAPAIVSLKPPQRAPRPAAALPVVQAAGEELAGHEAVLERIAKASGGRVLFKSA
jgi:DNA polymerase-3 subunit epsilon